MRIYLFMRYIRRNSLRAGMGENNCAWNRQLTIDRETLAAAAAIYKGRINSYSLLVKLLCYFDFIFATTLFQY